MDAVTVDPLVVAVVSDVDAYLGVGGSGVSVDNCSIVSDGLLDVELCVEDLSAVDWVVDSISIILVVFAVADMVSIG